MEILKRVTASNKNLEILIKELDRYLAISDGEEHDFYDQYNHLDNIKNIIILYIDQIPVGCGAFKEYQDGIAEVKRMYVRSEYRNNGYAGKILKSLEDWAKTEGYHRLVLETGKKMSEAVSFYSNNGYKSINNYGPYKNVDNSICFEKKL